MVEQAISHGIMVNLYKKEPKKDNEGRLIFKKSGVFLFTGLLLVILFSSVAAFMGYYVPEIMSENSIDSSMTNLFYICGYSITGLFILIGVWEITIFFKFKIIVSKEEITCKKIFSTQTLKLAEIEAITFSNRSVLIFRGSHSKIAFGSFTSGLLAMVRFIEENIPEYKFEKAVPKAKKMLRFNGIDC